MRGQFLQSCLGFMFLYDGVDFAECQHKCVRVQVVRVCASAAPRMCVKVLPCVNICPCVFTCEWPSVS